MRQAGYIAAAGIYALENNLERLSIDHTHAKQLEAVIKELPYIEKVIQVETNIVIFDLKTEVDMTVFLSYLENNYVLTIDSGRKTVRLVTHLDISEQDIEHVKEVFKAFKV